LIKPERKLKPFAEVKVAIKKELQYELAGKIFFDDSDQMNNLSYETPDSLESVAEGLGIKVKTSTLMTRRGGAGLFANPKILSAAFSDEVLKEGRNSEMLEISDTHLVVLRIKEHQVASVQALDKVEARIKDNLLQEYAGKKAQEVTSDILARLQKNENIESVAKRFPETVWNKTGWVKRKAELKSKLSTSIRQHVFAMPKPVAEKTSWDKITLPTGDQAVIALFKVEEADDGNSEVNNERVIQIIGKTDYDSFVKYLKSQADISISQAVLEAEAETN